MIRTLYLLLSLSLLLGQSASFAQIGISGTPHPSAVLDLKSPTNDKAFYPPRLSTAQRQAIPNPQVGAFVYDLDKNTMYLFDGQNWLPLLTADPNQVPSVGRTANDGAAADEFGYSVAISGDYAIVGAPKKIIGTNNEQGAAYVFVRSGNSWTQLQRLTASDGMGIDNFGRSVAISGDYAIVGAFQKTIGSNANQGAAYVFVRSGSSWNEQQRLTASDGAANNFLGTGVSISGDYAIVGAYNKTIGSNTAQGAAYVFVRSGSSWTQQPRLTATDGAASDYFGYSVAISGDYAFVGAFNKTISANSGQGAAYVFVRGGGTWTQQQRLTGTSGAAGDNFGVNVAISGDYAIAGAFGKTIGSNTSQGAAYVFVRSGSSWSGQQLLAPDAAFGDQFGYSVAISGNYAIVGAYGKTIGITTQQGAAYVFVRSGSSWSLQQRVTDNNSSPFTNNGNSVGLSNGTFIIGGPGFQNSRGKVGFGTVN